MYEDPIAEFKEAQRQGWKHFAPLEALTTPAAARLVKFASVRAGQNVLDVACGTGGVAITAARIGARVHGIDLTPELLERARRPKCSRCGLRHGGGCDHGRANRRACPR